MALYNVSTSGNSLKAIGNPSHATSELVLQDAEDTDFESIRETRVHWKLANISTNQSTADTAVTNVSVSNGDRIFIRKNSGEIIDTVAAGVSIAESCVVPIMTSNTSPEGVAYSGQSGGDAWKAFNANDSDSVYHGDANIVLQYTFKDNVPVQINNFYLKTDRNDTNFLVEGSVDGTNWSTISTFNNVDTRGTVFTIESPGEFSSYRIKNTSASWRVSAWDLLGDGVSIDTTAITAGETPDQVFLYKDSISFNGAVAVEKDIFYEYGNTGLSLYALTLYEDVVLTGRQIQTRIDFSATGNIASEITGQVYKALV